MARVPKIEIPAKLKVGARTYKIIASPENERWHELNSEYGHIDYSAREISLSTKNSDSQKRDTLVHETLHAIAKHMTLDEAWGDSCEDYINRLSNGLNMVFQDNPDFVKFLVK